MLHFRKTRIFSILLTLGIFFTLSYSTKATCGEILKPIPLYGKKRLAPQRTFTYTSQAIHIDISFFGNPADKIKYVRVLHKFPEFITPPISHHYRIFSHQFCGTPKQFQAFIQEILASRYYDNSTINLTIQELNSQGNLCMPIELSPSPSLHDD